MNLERGLTISLLIATISMGILLLKQKNQRYRLFEDNSRNKPFLEIDDVFREPMTLWWPGISGVEPRYFGETGLKGLGWEEFPAFNIKSVLKKQYGVKIIDWMVPPSKLVNEFETNRRPVCIYPYAWKDPKKEFSGSKKQHVSYALDYGGETNLGILIRKGEVSRFSKHFKESGDIDLVHLIEETLLTTSIIKGADYSKAILDTIVIKPSGDWTIKNRYHKSINLMVASQNFQLLKMLAAKRIDFVLDKLISPSDYRKAKLSPNAFDNYIYERGTINSYDDPNLIRYSVRCNLHPLNLQIVPTINKIIQDYSIWSGQLKWRNHRKKLEPEYNSKRFVFATHQRLGIEKQSVWYEKFKIAEKFKEPFKPIKKDQELIQEATKAAVTTPIKRQKILFKVFQRGSELAIFDEGLLRSSRTEWNSPYPPEIATSSRKPGFWRNLPSYLSKNVQKLIREVQEAEYGTEEIINLQFHGIKNLTIVGPTLPVKVFLQIVKKVKDLESQHLILTQQDIVKVAVKHIDMNLKHLSLIGVNLMKLNLSHKLRNTRILTLKLNDSIMSPHDLADIFKSQHQTLEEVDLSGMTGEFNYKTANIFANLEWNNLRVFYYTGSGINPSLNLKLVKALGPKMESLSLPSLDTQALDYVSQNYSMLKELYTDFDFSLPFDPIRLPETIETLSISIEHRGAQEKMNLSKLIFPNSLKNLLISEIQDDDDLLYLGKFIKNSLRELAIVNYEGNPTSLLKFLQNKNLINLKYLSLIGSRLNDEHIKVITHNMQNLEGLNVYSNIISDQSVVSLLKLKKLHTLDIV